MTILSIDTIHQNEDGTVYVCAVIEDVIQTQFQTLYDPPEYGPGFCEAVFNLNGITIPESEQDLIEMLEEFNLDWTLVDDSDSLLD